MYLAVDIGGTKTLVAVFSLDGEVVESQKFPTSQDYAQFKIDLANIVAKLSTKQFLKGAIGTRGTIDRAKGLLISGGGALQWRDVALLADIGRLVNCPLVIENDAKLSGLSEAMLVKDKYRKVVYITISSGIGGAYVVDGTIYPDTNNAEFGLMVYEHDGRYQTWENFASGKAIVEKYGQKASEIDDPEKWEAISKDIAVGLINISATLTPEVIIIGGGAGANLSRFEEPLNRWLNTFSEDIIGPRLVLVPTIIKAQRPEEAVIYGCYELAKQHTK